MQQEGSTDRAANARRKPNEGDQRKNLQLLCPGPAWLGPSLVAVAVAVRKMLFAYGLRLLATSPHQMYVWRLNGMAKGSVEERRG